MATALITGGAKRIGAILATHLAAQGWDLVLHYHRSEADALHLAEALRRDHGVTVTLCHADLAAPDTFADFWHALPPCTLMVHNASCFVPDRLEDFSLAQWNQHLHVHLTAPMVLAQGFMRQLPREASGNFILLGDGVMGWSIAPQFFSYSISKHAWVGAIDVLAAAMAPRARANVIALAPTLRGDEEPESLFERHAARAPLKRTGSPDEVCTALDFLLASAGVTGQVISLANGLNLAAARPPA